MPSTKEQFVMLIWKEIPEDLKIFLFVAGSEMALLAEASNGFYINGDDLPDDLPDEHPIFDLNEKLDGFIPSPACTIKEVYLNGVFRCGYFL